MLLIYIPRVTQEREEKCMAGLKDRYRQHHAAILHGQTAFDAVLAEESEDADAADEREEEEAAEEAGVASQQKEQQEAQAEEGARAEGRPAGAPDGRPLSTSGVESASVTLWPSAPTST